MLMIRLFRIGKKKQPSYKIVVTDKKNAPARGRFVEEVGTYNPLTKAINVKKDRVDYWISVGAQTSDTVQNLLVKNKIIEGEKRKIIFTKKEEVVEEKKPEAKAEETPVTEEPKPETKTEEVPAEEVKEEEPKVEETPVVEEQKTEEVKEETPAEPVEPTA
jgi:small subunit ribosomal protein S16